MLTFTKIILRETLEIPTPPAFPEGTARKARTGTPLAFLRRKRRCPTGVDSGRESRTVAERIIAELQLTSQAFGDDELAHRVGVGPRQTVN